jgi:signal transduction histidine kinase
MISWQQSAELPDRHPALALLRHDLCTPLNAILGFSGLLAEDERLDVQHRRYAANILASGTVLLRRVNALLAQDRIGGDAW